LSLSGKRGVSKETRHEFRDRLALVSADPLFFLTEVIWMSAATDELLAKIKQLSDEEQLRLVDAVLTNLGASEPQITRVWAAEASKRWAAYKSGKIATVSYEEVMAKHKR
jgi:putative addiction module component (TIGR02574 family)